MLWAQQSTDLSAKGAEDDKFLTIGQVSLIVMAETLPLVYPSKTGEAERP